MKNTYEIFDGKFYFHKGDEIKEFDLCQVIEELEKSTNNPIDEQNGKLMEFITAEDYLTNEEIVEIQRWVRVEIWQVEDAVRKLTKLTSKKITLDFEEIDLIKLLLSRMNEVSMVVYGKQKESILKKFNSKTK